ncbi:MAG TPA: transposase [Planctomycetaceae bacterium]|nr:transposase [Planctomycetaceae bacterium]
MPRTARASVGGICYHVLNRGNARAEVFHKDGDYRAFLTLIRDACERRAMRVIGHCLMPNHFHLLLWPRKDGDLSRWMQWLLTAHVRRYHRHYGGSGHVWQGRFKAIPIQHPVPESFLHPGPVPRGREWRSCSGRPGRRSAGGSQVTSISGRLVLPASIPWERTSCRFS